MSQSFRRRMTGADRAEYSMRKGNAVGVSDTERAIRAAADRL